MKNILVTGGAGFIGSTFVRMMVPKYPDYNIIVLDKMTYAGNLDNLSAVDNQPNYRFEKGDISDEETVLRVLKEYQIDTVVNFAGETHVDRSILDPHAFMHTHVMGVYILLEACRRLGINRFHHVSTDEVYGSIPNRFFSEDDRLQPNSPYAASKAGGEMMLCAYNVTYGLHTTLTRASNTFGPYQYPEKLIPFFITEAIDDRSLPLYGDGMQVRDWLYVEDHVTGIDVVLHQGKAGEIYNIGGEHEKYNIDVTRFILDTLSKPHSLIKYVQDRPGHDRRYAVINDKLRRDFNWSPQTDFETAMRQTIQWYLDNQQWWRKIKTGEYLKYYDKQYKERLTNAD